MTSTPTGTTKTAVDWTSALTGTSVDHYEITHLVGRGGMAAVFAGQDHSTGERLAIKILDPALAGDSTILDRFQREAAILRSLSGRAAPRYVGSGQSGAYHYLAQELLEGESLAALVGSRKLDASEVKRVAVGLLTALVHLQAERIVHRDITPANIMVESDFAIRLIDFGISAAPIGPQQLSRAGSIMGTPDFLSPEQARGASGDERTDLWAFGANIVFAFTSQSPYDSPPAGLLAAAIRGQVRDLSIANIPDTMLLPLLKDCLHPDPSKRPPNAHACLQRIDPDAAAALVRKFQGDWRSMLDQCTNCGHVASSVPVSWIRAGIGRLLGEAARTCTLELDNRRHRLRHVRCQFCRVNLLAAEGTENVGHFPPVLDLDFCPDCGRALRQSESQAFFTNPEDANRTERARQPCGYAHEYAKGAKHCIRCGESLAPSVIAEHFVEIQGNAVPMAFAFNKIDVRWPKLGGKEPPLVQDSECFLAGETRTRTPDGYKISIPEVKSLRYWQPAERSGKILLVPPPDLTVEDTDYQFPYPSELRVLPASSIRIGLRIRFPSSLRVPILEFDWTRHLAISAGESGRLRPQSHQDGRIDSTETRTYIVDLPTTDLEAMRVEPWNISLPRLQMERRKVAPDPVANTPTILAQIGRRAPQLKLDRDCSLNVVAEPDGSWPVVLPEIQLKADDGTTTVSAANIGLSGFVKSVPEGPMLRLQLDTSALGSKRRADVRLLAGARSITLHLELVTPEVEVQALSGLQPGPNKQSWLLTGKGPYELKVVGNGSTVISKLDVEPNSALVAGPEKAIDGNLLRLRGSLKEKQVLFVDVWLADYLNPARIRIECWPAITPEQIRQGVYFEHLNTVPKTSSDQVVGVAGRPEVVVGHSFLISAKVTNNLDLPVRFNGCEVPEVTNPTAATAKIGARLRVDPGSTATLNLRVTPGKAGGETVFTFEIPVSHPSVGATIPVQVPVEGVLPSDPAACFYYDFGTSNTALLAPLANSDNFLCEAQQSFVRSRIFALWIDGEGSSTTPSGFEAPISDAEVISETFRIAYCGYALIEEVKTSFRLDQTKMVPIVQLRKDRSDRVVVPWFSPPTAFTLFEEAQYLFARYVTKLLRSVPTRVLTALPITLRGPRRRRALDAMQRAFSKACDRSVVVEAPLDESTASAMEVLYDLSRPERAADAHVVVVDIGGGTTDITCFDVSSKGTKCVGFDGMGIGGNYVTSLVGALLAEKAAAALKNAGPGNFDVPYGRNTPIGLENLKHLRPIAEEAKLALMGGASFGRGVRLRGEDDAPTADAVELIVSGKLTLDQQNVELTLHPDDFLEEPSYLEFLSEVVERALHARNLSYQASAELPPATHVLLRGQASGCPKLRTLLQVAFGVEPDNLTAKARKRAVVTGLSVMNNILQESSFRIGGIEKTVLVPVGRPDWSKVPLPRFFPLNVPSILWAENDVLKGMRNWGLPAPAVKLRPTSRPAPLAQGQVELPRVRVGNPPPDAANPRDRNAAIAAARLRFRYCIWVNAEDELHGALFQRTDSDAAIQRIRSHPALLLLRSLLAAQGTSDGLPKPADFEEGGRLFRSLTGDDGEVWTTRMEYLDLVWLSVHLVARSGMIFRFRFTSSDQESPWSEWLDDIVQAALEQRVDGYPQIVGVRLAEKLDETITIAFVDPRSATAPAYFECKPDPSDGGQLWTPVTDADLDETATGQKVSLVNHFESYGLWLRDSRERK